jgi:acetyl esterase/lipase
MLVILRDRGIPLPAGAILISPWCDLTHSFPSVAGNNPLDYVPPYGFQQKPSPSWPPPNSDDILAIEEGLIKTLSDNDHSKRHESEADAVLGFHVDTHPNPRTKNANADTGTNGSAPIANTIPGSGEDLSIMIDGKLIESRTRSRCMPQITSSRIL